MLKNISKLECRIEEKTYQFLCDMDCPTNHVKNALFQFHKLIEKIEEDAMTNQEPEVKEEIKPEE